MDKQRRPAGAGRVLGLLPPQLDAHAALRARLARALRGRRPARDRRPLPRLRALVRPGRGARRRSRGSTIRYPVVHRLRPRALGRSTATRAGRPATCSTARSILVDYHYGEGAYDETERAIAGAARRRARAVRARCGPRTRPAPLLAPQTADQAGAYSGPYEAGGVWAVLSGAGRAARQRRASSPSTGRAACRCVEHERHTAGVLELEVRRGSRATPRASPRAWRPELVLRCGRRAGAAAAAGRCPRSRRTCRASTGCGPGRRS